MTVKSDKLDFWRVYFRSSNSDLFDIIDNAITIAIIDCPTELKLRRDRIAEKLFSCHMSVRLDHDCVEYSNPKDGEGEEDVAVLQKGFDTKLESGGSKESKVNSSRDYHGEFQLNQTSNYSYGDAEALTDEIEEENLIFQEVLRIKEIIENNQDESDTVLFDSLRKLQLMDLSVDTLKATKIGKSVNSLRKHGSKQIRNLARILIDVWKQMVDEWVKVTTDIVAEATPESGNPSVVNEVDEEEEEEGLPSPPLDDLAFIDTHTTSMELSKFFDGMDEDGNPQNSRELSKNRDSTRNQRKETRIVPPNQRKEQVKREETVVMKQQKPSPSKEFEQRRMTKPNVQPKPQSEVKVQPRMQMKPQPPSSAQLDKSKTNLDDNARLEITKRKLHDSYQQVQNAKRQRTIQVMEIQDLPKQGLGHRNPHMKPGNNNNRNWKNGVRR